MIDPNGAEGVSMVSYSSLFLSVFFNDFKAFTGNQR